MSNVIGISGKARSGKDSLFAIAAKDGWTRASFAEDLKRRAREDMGLGYEHTDGLFKETPQDTLAGHTPREFLIELGNVYRKFRPTFWVDQVVALIEHCPQMRFMITDVRYPNEADAILKLGGKVIRLERHPDRDSMVDEKTKLSISETALDDYKNFSYVLAGTLNKTISDLEKFWSFFNVIQPIQAIDWITPRG